MNKIVYDYEVIQDIFEEKEVLVGLTPYEPTVAPTAEPTKPAPTTPICIIPPKLFYEIHTKYNS